MKITPTEIPDVLLLEPTIFPDSRGFFFESYNARKFEASGIGQPFVQDNHSSSVKNVVRGLHYQIEQPQGKLVRIIVGRAFDVAVDLRESSKTFGKWVGVELSAENRRMLWIPVGFAHGFLAMTDNVEMLYKTTDFYSPQNERTILWNDAALGIEWPAAGPLIVSQKDAQGAAFDVAPKYPSED